MVIQRGHMGIQRRAVRANGWTKTKRAGFLDHLAMTCNVRASARLVGMSPENAQKLRRRDPEFAQLWADAIAAGRTRLEEELLAHSLGQLPSGDNPGAERAEGPAVPFDPRQALDTLKTVSRRDRPAGSDRPPAVASEAEVNALLMERLEALARRKRA